VRYQIRLSRLAESYLRRLDARTRARFEVEFRRLAEDPYASGTKPLTGGEGERASRVGGWRILYTIKTAERILEVNDVGPRGQIYRRR
jgi:mRNA interferase RelE/StbE